MAKLPYGFDANPIYETRQPKDEAEAWERLDEVQLSLEKGEAVAPKLAAWLGEAIDHAKRDPTELLRRLGVERGRGKPKGDPNAWFTVGKRICNLEDTGMKPERAVSNVAAELDEKYSRSQFQKFRDAYRAAWHVAHNPE
ncbi:hypothetical protein [Pararhodobacter aggregans]